MWPTCARTISKRPTGRATAAPSSSIAMATSSDSPLDGDKARSDRHRFRHPLQQRSRDFAGRHAACDQRQLASRSRIARLHPPDHAVARRTALPQKSPSYWHGWSPDGKTLAFVGQRNGDFDIYAIPVRRREKRRASPRQRPGRWSGIFARRKVHLLQFRAYRPHADLAHEARRQRAGTSLLR